MDRGDYLEINAFKSHCENSVNKLNEKITKLQTTQNYLLSIINPEEGLKGQYFNVWSVKMKDLSDVITVFISGIQKDIEDYNKLKKCLEDLASEEKYDGDFLLDSLEIAQRNQDKHSTAAGRYSDWASKSFPPLSNLFSSWASQEQGKADEWGEEVESIKTKMGEYDSIEGATGVLFTNSGLARRIALLALKNILDGERYIESMNESLDWRLDMIEYISCTENGIEVNSELYSEKLRNQLENLKNSDGSSVYTKQEIDAIVLYLRENDSETLYNLVESYETDKNKFDELRHGLNVITYDSLICGPHSDYYETGIKKVEINGKIYYYEMQNEAWSSVIPQERSVGGAGCFLFATAAAISEVKGTPYTLEQMFYDAGANLTYSNGKYYLTPGNGGYIPDLNGSPDRLQNSFRRAGIDCTVNDLSLNRPTIDEIKQGLRDGKTYVVRYKKTGDGEDPGHWITFAGLDEDGNIIVLCSNSEGRNTVIANDYSELKDGYRYMEYVYEVSPN